jgi:hypothetical protein
MTQALYAHMNNKTIKKKELCSGIWCFELEKGEIGVREAKPQGLYVKEKWMLRSFPLYFC